MEEKSLEFFEKYEITVTGTVRTRGAFRIDTEDGPKLLLPYSGSEQRAVFEQNVLAKLSEKGFLVDCYVANKEGTYVTKDEYEEPFLMKNWYYGEECNVKKPDQAILAVRHLAVLHNALTGIKPAVDVTSTETETNGAKSSDGLSTVTPLQMLPGAVQKSLPELFEKLVL